MNSGQLESQKQTETKIDDIYIQIWQGEQEHTRTRWTATAFFLSISFAILGFSFQNNLARPVPSIIRTVGLIIYWFAFILFWHLYRYNKFLRTYLTEMEKSGRTNLDLQSKSSASPAASEIISTTRMLFYFGVIYAAGIIILWLLGF